MTCVCSWTMELLCALLVLTVALVTEGIYNPYHHETGQQQGPQTAKTEKLQQLSPPLETLFYEHSTAEDLARETSGGKVGKQPDPVNKVNSPKLPARLSDVSSLRLAETPTERGWRTAGRVPPVGLWQGGTMVGPNSEKLESGKKGYPRNILPPPVVDQAALIVEKIGNTSHALPAVFAMHKLSSKPFRKIRRNRDRNDHRKAIQRHAGRKGKHVKHNKDTAKFTQVELRLPAYTITQQQLRLLAKDFQSQMAHMNMIGSDAASQRGQLVQLKAIGSREIPKEGIRLNDIDDQLVKMRLGSVRQRRRKRATTLLGPLSHDTLPGETFYYRQPDGPIGSVSRPRNQSGTQPDSLVHNLEIKEGEENKEQEDERNQETQQQLPFLSQSTPIEKQVAITEERVKQGSHGGKSKRPEAPVEKKVAAGPSANQLPQDQPLGENIHKLDDMGVLPIGSLFDNTTMNETLARQMYRSPMLVDYGSRAKPQDVLQPTESDADEEGLAETKAEDTDPSWTEDKGTDDAISLEENPLEVDEAPTQLPTFASETKQEPVQPMEVPLNIPLPTGPASDSASAVEEEIPQPEIEAESEKKPDPEPEPPAVSEEEANEDGESENKVEPEQGKDEPAVEGAGNSYAEPQPEWDEAKKLWGPWWEIHIYGIGLGFTILSIYSFASIVRLWRKKNLLSQGYFIALNIIMFVIGISRALYFLIDGYNSRGTFSMAGHYFLYSIGFPCLTSAFSILLLALLQTLKMQLLSTRIQRTRVVVGIIAAHFLLSISTDIIVGYLSNAKIMMLVCQVATVFWGIILFIGYIYVFRKLYKAAKWRQTEMMRMSLAKFKLDGIAPITKGPHLTLSIAVKITLSTAIFGLFLAALQTYGLVGIENIFSNDVPHPWLWLAFNTGMRLIELAMCITMSYVATQPFRYKQGGKSGDMAQSQSCFSTFIYMAPCRRIFECDSVSLHDDDLSWNDLPVTSETGQVDSNGTLVISEEATPMTANGRAAHAAAAAVVHNHNEQQGSSGSKRSNKVGVAARPASLLVSDNGFIRFREDGEMGGSPVLVSTDDELENISGDNMIRNPFYRDLLRRQEKERAVGRATFVNSDGITLQDEFGLVESVPDPELVPPPRPAYPVTSSYRGCSHPNTGTNTPGTPRSFCSTDLDYAASEGSYRPPSSIHLRDSIENALNIPGFTLRTPDILDSPLNATYLRTRRGSLFGSRIGARPLGTGSMSDLESLRHYGPGSRYGDSEDTVDQLHNERAASPDSMYSYTLSNLTRAPLVRSYSDSIGKPSQPEVSYPNSPERRYYKDRLRASMLRNLPENTNQFQNLLKNINEMCNVYNKLSPDDREADE